MTFDNSGPVLVTGASGFVGSHIVRLLVEAGRDVRVLLRKSSQQTALSGLPLDIRYGDALDLDSLVSAMTGCSTVFWSVVDPRFWLSDPSPLYQNNLDGLINGMEAALSCGVKRFLFTSSIGTLGFNRDGLVTEDIPFNWHDRASPYILARLAAEERLLEYCRDRGLPGVALCVANTYGPQDYQPTPHGKALWEVADGQMTTVLDCSQPTVDVRDAAAAALLAECYGVVGQRYIIANEYVSNRRFYALAVAERGNKMPRIVSLRLAWAVAWIAQLWFKMVGRRDTLISTDAVFLSNAFKAMDNSKARSQLHWHPRPLKDTIRDAVAWYASHHGA